MIDFKNCKTDKDRADLIRETISKVCYNALITEFGEDNVRYAVHELGVGENGKKMSKGTVFVAIDQTDKDGFNVQSVTSFCPTVHKWNETTTARKTTPAILLPDIDTAIEEADKRAATIEEKKRKLQEIKEKRIAENKAKKGK